MVNFLTNSVEKFRVATMPIYSDKYIYIQIDIYLSLGYNKYNHEISDVHGDTQANPLRAATLRGFFLGLSVLLLFIKPLGD